MRTGTIEAQGKVEATDGIETTEITKTGGGGIFQTEILPIGWGKGGTVPPDAIETIVDILEVRKFSGTVVQDINLSWSAPPSLKDGTTGIEFRVIFIITEATGPVAQGVVFGLKGVGISSGSPLGTAFGSSVLVSKTGLTEVQNDVIDSGWSGEVPIANLVAGNFVKLNLFRKADDPSDNYTQKVGVWCLEIRYPVVFGQG